MAYEVLRAYYGTEKRFFKKFPALSHDLGLIRRTANTHRHAFKARDTLFTAIEVWKAHAIIREVFETIANDIDPRPNTELSSSELYIDSYKSEGGMTLLDVEIREVARGIWTAGMSGLPM